LKPAEALSILRPLADALDYAHGKGLVHRDVKPANVIFDERNQPVLTDFGIAKAAEDSRLTTTGASIGTPHYMAPEQIQGKEIDARTDQYALAIIAFELLTGSVPFDAATTTAVLYKQVNESPPSVTAFCPELPPGVQVALNRALSKSPVGRYGTCGEFVDALHQATMQPARPIAPYMRPMEQPAPTLLVQPGAAKRETPPPPSITPPPRPGAAGPARKGRGMPLLLLVGAGVVGAALIALVIVLVIAAPKPAPTVPTPAA
jgi:serine/threonine-protein kinase